MNELLIEKIRAGCWIATCPDCGDKREINRFAKFRAVKSGDTRCRSCACKRAKDARRHNTECILFVRRIDKGWIVRCPDCSHEHKISACQVSYQVKRGHTRCRSCAVSGKAHWRFNEFAKQKRIYQRSEWKRVARIVRKRDKICQFPACERTRSSDGRALSVHHIEPLRINGEHDLNNLIALCTQHHAWSDLHLDESIPLLRNIMAKKLFSLGTHVFL